MPPAVAVNVRFGCRTGAADGPRLLSRYSGRWVTSRRSLRSHNACPIADILELPLVGVVPFVHRKAWRTEGSKRVVHRDSAKCARPSLRADDAITRWLTPASAKAFKGGQAQSVFQHAWIAFMFLQPRSPFDQPR